MADSTHSGRLFLIIHRYHPSIRSLRVGWDTLWLPALWLPARLRSFAADRRAHESDLKLLGPGAEGPPQEEACWEGAGG